MIHLIPELFWSHVFGRSRYALASPLCLHNQVCYTEVQQIYPSIGGKHYVSGLNIPVHYSLPVGILESPEDFHGYFKRLLNGQWAPFPYVFVQSDPIDIIHHYIESTLVLPEVVNLHDIGMVQFLRHHLGFPVKHGSGFFAVGKYVLQHLKSHLSPESDLLCLEDIRHTTGGNLLPYSIFPSNRLPYAYGQKGLFLILAFFVSLRYFFFLLHLQSTSIRAFILSRKLASDFKTSTTTAVILSSPPLSFASSIIRSTASFGEYFFNMDFSSSREKYR